MLVHDLVRPAPGRPLCLVLHGLGDSKEGWKAVAPMLGLDGWGWCFVQAPDGYDVGYSWFDLDLGRMHVDAAQVRRSHGLLLGLLAHLEAAEGLPCERIALVGFSQGCLMTLETVLRHPRRFLAAIGISGWLHRDEDWPSGFGPALAQQRLLVTHGRWDPLIPIALARTRIERLRRLGVPLLWAEYDKEHSLDPHEEVPDLRAHLLDAERKSTDGLPTPGGQA